MVTQEREANARVRIDKALEASGWNLLDPHQVEYEYKTTSGRADYLLRDGYGRVLSLRSIGKTLNRWKSRFPR